MIGLDTNVIVRYFMQDDPAQALRANRFMEALRLDDPAFVSVVAILELVWVLESCYDLESDQVLAALEGLLRTKEIVVERAELVWQAVRTFRDARGDFADHLIERCGAAAGCEWTLTFDRAAVRLAGMRLLA